MLYNRERAHLNAEAEYSSEYLSVKKAYPTAFSELIAYIIETKPNNECSEPVVLKLADLAFLYCTSSDLINWE